MPASPPVQRQSRANARVTEPTRAKTSIARSSATNHQQSSAVRCFDQAVFVKARFLVCPDRTVVDRVRIGRDARYALAKQIIDEAADKRGAVAATNHVGFTDKQVDSTRSLGLLTETCVPFADGVTLKITQRIRACRKHELVHVRFVLICADQFVCSRGSPHHSATG